ncbi:MAG: SpoIID/LytB domain-containing protein [Patescibacteria group bacterium]|nr:SpoIID/LytB domain-containing protein [Patescibacteria group bacterium]MCL5431961.1 SpoIID/LytB domain-containing protein [Patescibacteria group bacterium]
MRKKLLVTLAAIFVPLFLFSRFVLAESCSTSCSDNNLDACIAECNKLLDISINATKPSEQQMNQLEAEISSIQTNIQTLTTLIDRRKAQVDEQSKKLAGEQESLNDKVRNYYERSYQFNVNYLLTLVFSGSNAGDVLRGLSYWQSFINRDKQTIINTAAQLVDLNNSRKTLEKEQVQLAAQKQSLEVTLAPVKDLVDRAKAYQAQLSQTAGALSSRQQQLIAARIGSLNLSRSAGGSMVCSDDRKIDPGFSPAFAFYTFGIPHRVGMNQYGAYGRAKYDNEGYDQILHAYYNFDGYKDADSNIRINVNDGNNVNSGNIVWSGSLGDYVKRIYEVPDSWPPAALEAQAIAARSYVLAATNNGSGSICANQNCQVFKTDPKGGNWDQAVNDTGNKVMILGGQVIKAWFSSTDGGYTLASAEYGWSDTPWTKHTRDTSGDIGSFSDLFSKAYDRDSSCFYNAQGWRTQYNKSAWLTPAEVADIANVILLVRKNPADACFVFQPDKSAPSPDKDCPQTDNWSPDRVRQELGSAALSAATSVEISGVDFGSGRTTEIKINGISFDGTEFKNYFDIRAPANIAIVGPLFNVEKR